jgi:hypothetical protein
VVVIAADPPVVPAGLARSFTHQGTSVSLARDFAQKSPKLTGVRLVDRLRLV